MTAYVREFIDFESGQLKGDADPLNWSGATTSKDSLVTSPAPPYGTYTLKIAQDKTSAYFRGPLFTFTSGTKCITCAYVRFDSTNFPPPATNPVSQLVAMIDENDASYWYVDFTSNRWLQLYDGSATLLDTKTGVDADKWYRIEVVWEPGNSNSAWEWYVTEAGLSSALEGSGTGADFTTPSGADIGIWLKGQGGELLASPMNVYHGGLYIMENATDIEDRVGGPEGKNGDWYSIGTGGKITKNSPTPDCDENGNPGSGDDLDSGDTWDDAAGDDLDATVCRYTRTYSGGWEAAKGGGVKLDAPASRAADYIYAMKYLWYAKATSVNVFKAVHGLYDPVDDVWNVSNTYPGQIGMSYRYARRVQDWRETLSDAHPQHRYQMVIGMLNDKLGRSGPDHVSYFAEGWGFTLHAVPVVTGKPSLGRFGKTWRGKKGRPL